MKVNLQNQVFKHANPQDVQMNLNQNTQNADISMGQMDFRSIMNATTIASKQTVFENLMENLSKQEKIIIKNPTLDNIKLYKCILSDVLNLISENFNCNEMELYSNAGYRKFVNASEVIDKEFQSIVDNFLETNRVSMSIIDSFANIRGLLFEIYI